MKYGDACTTLSVASSEEMVGCQFIQPICMAQ